MTLEMPEKFDALIVLGAGWNKFETDIVDIAILPPKYNLNMEAKIRTLAAGEMFREKLADKIIFSGGKTAGRKWLSEAKAMQEYLKNKFPEIPDDSIIIEEESIDTPDNAEKILPILEKYKIQNAALMTSAAHLPRAQKIFETFGIETHPFPAENELKKRSLRHLRFVKNYLKSDRVKKMNLREKILRGIFWFDKKGRSLRLITKKTRK